MGEVQEIGNTFVITKRGLVSKDEFYLPKYLVEAYDGRVVLFNIIKQKAKSKFSIAVGAPGYMEQYKSKARTDIDLETRIPLIGEELKVYKTITLALASNDNKRTCHRGKDC